MNCDCSRQHDGTSTRSAPGIIAVAVTSVSLKLSIIEQRLVVVTRHSSLLCPLRTRNITTGRTIRLTVYQVCKHPPKREQYFKFVLVLAVFVGYFSYISWQYGLATGGVVTALTWSFFVLCTPVADAGFLLDFPIRLITGIRMWIVEIVVWGIAIVLNGLFVIMAPDTYQQTFITTLLYTIVTTPWPYWSIIVLCCIGTFLSVRFGDEMMDVMSHARRRFYHRHGFLYRLISMAALLLLIVWTYAHLLESLQVAIPHP